MSIGKKIIGFLPRLVAARKGERKRRAQARWERRIQIEALESMAAELGRQLGLWQRRMDALNGQCCRGSVLSDADLELAKVVARHIEILTQQQERLQRGLAKWMDSV
jgi:hypothetical protein